MLLRRSEAARSVLFSKVARGFRFVSAFRTIGDQKSTGSNSCLWQKLAASPFRSMNWRRVSAAEHLRKQRMPLPEATRETALSRLRPVLMTALVVPAIYPWFARGLSFKEDSDDAAACSTIVTSSPGIWPIA